MEYDEYEFEFESKFKDDLDALEDLNNDNEDSTIPYVRETQQTSQLSVQRSIRTTDTAHNTSPIDKISSSSRSQIKYALDRFDSDFVDNKTQTESRKRGLEETPFEEESPVMKPVSSSKRSRHNSSLDDDNHGTCTSLLLTHQEADKTKAESRVLRRIPPGGYVSSTTGDGTRLYMRLLSDNDQHEQKLFRQTVTRTHQLLPKNFNVMYHEILQEKEQQLSKEIIKANAVRQQYDTSPKTTPTTDHNRGGDDNGSLWVDKYKPAGYLDLLSDDGTNRALLRWLKLWDKVVFNREVKPAKALSSGLESSYQSKRGNQGNNQVGKPDFQQKFQRRNALSDIISELDCLNCPRQKIALLCGPPGLGKTTLAHIIAAHAGYNVVEMNASDDRSPDAFRIQIEAATQMRSVMGRNPKPNCLIIDEIDGAPLAAINVLLNVISNKAHEEGKKTTTKKKQRDEFGPLLRPIICICNDQYVPALRLLRGKALMLTFPPTLSVRLATRLMEVSLRQCLKTDMSALLALCTKADNDIRSCLSTLQFIHGKRSSLRMSDVNSLSVGLKDIQKSLFSVWQEIFQIPRSVSGNSAKKVKDATSSTYDRFGIHEVDDNTSLSARFYKVLSLVQSYGEYNKINRGLFENFPNLNYKEYGLESTSAGCDWLCFSDVIDQEISHLQNYSLMAYQPFTAVAFHLLFAVNSYPKLVYPSSHYELKTKITKSVNIVNGLISETAAALRPYVNLDNLVADTLPLLMKIIQPQLRPVNTQLYNAQEKADLLHCIEVMILFNLTYLQQCNLEGQFNYSINPEIDVVGCFSPNSGREMTYASKQMIAREIDLEKMRRNDTEKREQTKVSAPPSLIVKEQPKQEINPSVPNHQQTLQPKILQKKTVKQTVDFFGRVVTKSAGSIVVNAKESCNTLGDGDIWFRFKEGYSNAVRKNVRISDLA